jgi:replicative DNA helicase
MNVVTTRSISAELDEPRLRVPPHSVEAEQSVLGGLLIDNRVFDRLSDLVTESDFYSSEHRYIFAAISVLIAACKPVDVVTVFEAMQSAGTAEKAGGLVYLNQLAQSVPSASNARRYAEIVRGKSVRRALISATDEAKEIALGAAELPEALDRIDRLIDSVRSTQVRKEPTPLHALLLRAIDRYSAAAEGAGVDAWATGIEPLDRLLHGGLRPGKVYGIAARPSVGKSSAARHVAISLASAGHASLLLSMEMPGDELADCIVAQLGRVDSGRVQRGALQDEDWGRVSEAVERGARLPLHIDDEGGLTLATIRNKARMVKGLRVLLVDYLQLGVSSLKGATTNDQIAEITKGLKALALSMGIAVVLLSQLNREVERRADKEPVLADLRDSGAIEQDLDVAVLLWTAREFDEGARRIVGWKVAKNRGGPKGRFAMEFEPAVYRWSETTASLEPPTATERRPGRRDFE